MNRHRSGGNFFSKFPLNFRSKWAFLGRFRRTFFEFSEIFDQQQKFISEILYTTLKHFWKLICNYEIYFIKPLINWLNNMYTIY